jgi:hypothetical protein
MLDVEPGHAERLGITVRRMPEGASRFASTDTKKTKAAYRFLTELAKAVSPLPIEMTFLFDLDEKDPTERERINTASGGRARFLPVRELENLFLDPVLLSSALAARTPGSNVPAPAQVKERLEALLGDKAEDGRLLAVRGHKRVARSRSAAVNYRGASEPSVGRPTTPLEVHALHQVRHRDRLG